MWDSNTESGERQQHPWQTGEIKTFKLKIPLDDYLDGMVDNHMDIHYPEWNADQDKLVQTEDQVFVYLTVDVKTGVIEVVGIDGHPLDKTRQFKDDK